ncbi:MAG: hypothetical protein ACYC42_01620 [Lysobacter sp.]
MALALAGCAATDMTSPEHPRTFAGWYREHAGQGIFQPCGESQLWKVEGSPDLSARARQFGLDEDTPVYVRVRGTRSAGDTGFKVSEVEQFGSTMPVRDCGMNGVVIPAPVGQ